MKKIVIANLKMNFVHPREAEDYVARFAALCKKRLPQNVAAVFCPPLAHHAAFCALTTQDIALGAQNTFWEQSGAFTGESSPEMLKNIGAQFVIVGHSERRAHLGETDAMIGRKVAAAVDAGLTPIICVGDTAEDRAQGVHFDTVEEQLRASVAHCATAPYDNMIFAYEPVWAISTNRAADSPEITSDDILSMKVHIKKVLSQTSGQHDVQKLRVIYGGSVDAQNAQSTCGEPGMDGALVGGASLDPEKFMRVLEAFAKM